jgi:hypothetical protein
MADSCEPLRSQVRGQEQLVLSLQDELRHASPAEKPFLISQIREANHELAQFKARLTACEQSNPKPDAVVLTTDTCPICTDEQISAWRHVVLEQQGVDGVDVDGHWIGAFPNDSKQFLPNINNWIPLATEKRVLCGNLHHFNFYDPFTSGDEADWNNFIIPTPAFANLIEDAKIHGTSSAWHSCEGTFDCMEAEITPDETYYENLFNSKELDRSALEGEVICTYGPWVREYSHDNRPEIHPSELYWWRSRLPNGKFAYNLMQLQEDSNRFDREENYDFGFPWDDPPPGWRAWSAVPRTNRFRIAFELDPTAPQLTFRISQTDARFVQDRWNDQTPGSTHDLQYNGRVVLRVEELLPNEADLGVAFGSICRNAENTRLQGYIALIESVGENDRGSEGYQTLQLEVDNPPFFHDEFVGDWPEVAPLQRRTSGPIVKIEAKPNSLRRVASESGPLLVGDAEIRMTARSGATATTVDLAKVKVDLVSASGRRELRFRPTAAALTGKESSGIIEELPLTAEATLEVNADGEVVSLPAPTLSLAPRVVAALPQQLTKADGAWKALSAVAAGRDIESPLPGSVQRSRRWRIEVAPGYSPLRAGKASPEDESPFAEALNDILHSGNKQRLSEIFGTAAPLRVNWSFRATNLTTGKQVLVQRGDKATPTDVRVDVSQSESLNAVLDVTFPAQPANAVFELVATAKMRDPFGVVGTVQQRVSSHVITHADARELAQSMVQTAASLAGASPDELDTASVLGGPVIDHQDDNPRVADPRTNRAQMVRLLALDASQDQRITVDELRRLVRGAKRFASAK